MNRLLRCLATLTLLLAGCPADDPATRTPRTLSTRPGSCDGFVDFQDELRPRAFQLVSQTPVGGGLDQVEISLELENLDAASFVAATATAVGGEDLGLVPVLGAEFGSVAPGAVAPSAETLVLQLPSTNVAELMARLASGEIDVTVHADEQPIYADDVDVASWRSQDAVYYAQAIGNPDPGPGPFAPGQVFGLTLLALNDDAVSVVDDFEPGRRLYLVEDPENPTALPDAFDAVRVLSVVREVVDSESSPPFGRTTWAVIVQRTDTEDLPSIYRTASFCTGASAHVDLPVRATRLTSVDGDPVEDAERDTKPQPIRFNDIRITEGITLSGQIAGHVLKPSLELRLRAGAVRAVADFDTDLSLSAELRAEATATFEPEPLALYDLCFPVADLPAGPVPISLNLQLEHVLEAEGSLTAGAVVGIQKGFRSGFTVGYDARRPEGDRYFSTPRHEASEPIEFTPPQLTDDTAARASVGTELRTTLRVGGPYPLCDTGPGAYLAARARGHLDVVPAQDPWWSLGHDAELVAGIDLQLLGLEVAAHETPLASFAGGETRDSGPGAPALAGARATLPFAERSSGEDQRWSVAIEDVTTPDGTTLSDSAALADGGVVALSGSATGRHDVVRLDRFGAFAWSVDYRLGYIPRRVVALPDGSLLVAGTVAWLSRLSADGALLWSLEVDLSRSDLAGRTCTLRDVLPIEVAPGVYDYVVTGTSTGTIVTQNDACAFRVTESGAVLWAKVYVDPGVQEMRSVILARDGRLVVVGRTQTGPDLFSLDNALVAKLDAADGSVVWAKSLPMYRSLSALNGVVEAEDGTLFAVGSAGRIITQSHAALLVRIAGDGSDVRHAMVIQDESWEAQLDFEPLVDTAGGDTAYDELFAVTDAPGGYVAVGRTGLGDATAAWALRFDEQLGADWFATYDGPSADALDAIVRTPDGFVASGFSSSLPNVSTTPGSQLWIAKLPFEGRAWLDPAVGMTARFLAPGVRDTTGDPSVVPNGIVSMDAPLAVIDLVVDSAGPIANALATPNGICVELLTPSGRLSTADACLDDADADGVDDALDNCAALANADQLDTDEDGYGNACDPDLTQDGVVGLPDFNALRGAYGRAAGAPGYDPDADLTGDGVVGLPDFNALRSAFGGAPGPSGLACAGSVPCAAP